MVTLILPAYSAGPNLRRTIDSCREVCTETIIVSTSPFPEDVAEFRELTPTVVELPWNFVFQHGYGELHNQGTRWAKNDWLLVLGVAETFAEPYCDIWKLLRGADPKFMFRCDHVNDENQWKRIWNRQGGTFWSGIIHEEITGGYDGQKLFRMQDTDKTPFAVELKNEVLRYIKTCSYNWLYLRLLKNPALLGGASRGWLKFVDGAQESIVAFNNDHSLLIDAAVRGDFDAFIRLVEGRMSAGKQASGVKFNPQGT